MASSFPGLDSLNAGNADLQRLLAGLQHQQKQGFQQQAASAALVETAAKRQRLAGTANGSEAGGMMGALGSAVTSQGMQHHLASLSAPLGTSLPFLPLGTSASNGNLHAMSSGHGFGQLQAQLQAQQAHLAQQAQQQGMLAASALHGFHGGTAGMSPPPQQAQQLPHQQPPPPHQHGVGSGGSHSHEGTDSGEQGSGEGHRRGGKRSSEERLNANKEKNRRAQQRFRLRQKEKMVWLEAELQRLKALCVAHNLDPSPNAPPLPAPHSTPSLAGGAGPPLLMQMPVHPQQQQADVLARAADAGQHAAAAQAQAMAQQQAMRQQAMAQPSTEQMHEELELMLDRCPAVPSNTAIAYLTAFQRSDAETKRCQYRSLRRRFQGGRVAEISSCISHWLTSGSASTDGTSAAAAAAPATAATAAALVPTPGASGGSPAETGAAAAAAGGAALGDEALHATAGSLPAPVVGALGGQRE